MAYIALSTLRTIVRQRTNTEASQVVTDSELNSYINLELAALCDLMITAGQKYFANNTIQMDIINGQDTYPLPTGSFYELDGVDWRQSSGSGDWFPMHHFEHSERDNFIGYNFFGTTTTLGGPFRYELRGESLILRPPPGGNGGQIQLWFISTSTDLVNDSDTFNFLNHWDEYVINGVCSKVADKIERDPSFFERQQAKVEERIRQVIDGRDSGEPSCAVNPDRRRPFGWTY